ncbi:hypothetical protein CAC42_1476 [Sphaceloma murrayae]|uniref:Uncharacterized protein n=1 Tax=Sphaceloma murrayae TaxID=2082308 RepID=A0A2K1QYD6_9PEZI|nr:hypothetical protein CAC42_1476 [Sphaceloma murrayae]
MTTKNPASTSKLAPNRLPAPALFVGPPSRNASNLSLVRPGASRPPTSHVPDSPLSKPVRPSASPPSSPTYGAGSILDLTKTTSESTHLRPRPSKSSIEAQWSDLQRTLNEVETAAPGTGLGGIGGLTAGSTVFGTGHGKALEELRAAQIRLAEAWGPTYGHGEEKEESDGKDHLQDRGAKTETRKVSGRSGQSGGSHGSAGSLNGSQEGMEQAPRHRDGEADLKTAAERREKNEQYFQKVKAGVEDVVAKLNEVSKAMRRVESEGREIWEESSLESKDRESQGKVAVES